jgi:hypothetical protein
MALPLMACVGQADYSSDKGNAVENRSCGQTRLPLLTKSASVARCVAASARLLAGRPVHLSHAHVGERLRFADGSTSRVYLETIVDRPPGLTRCAPGVFPTPPGAGARPTPC